MISDLRPGLLRALEIVNATQLDAHTWFKLDQALRDEIEKQEKVTGGQDD